MWRDRFCGTLFILATLVVPVFGDEPAYSVRESGGEWWLHDPGGRKFFSLGVCVADQGTPREKYDGANPSYAAWLKYPTPSDWAKATNARLRRWHFTTVGGWGDYAALLHAERGDLAITPVLGCGAMAGAPWWDMWSEEKVLGRMDELAGQAIEPVRNHAQTLGYYTDNELGWWNAALWKMTLEDRSESGARQRLLDLLRRRYQNDWSKLTVDFDPDGAASFDELEQGGMLYLRPDGNGIHAEREFLGLIARRYYEVAHDLARKYDQRALILGDRYQSFYYPEVARAAAEHVDVVSTNLNAAWNDGTFPRFYLDTLHELTGKPILVSEFYMSAMENRTGNRNTHGNFPRVATQAERVAGFERTLQSLARLPYVVGADWFQYYDEPAGGRFDGEDYNFGLVDIEDRPYEELTERAAALDASHLKGLPRDSRPDARGGVPRANGDPLSDFQDQLALKKWDRERGFVPPQSKAPLADLYICWTPEAIYLGVYLLEPIEPEYYRDGRIPEMDRTRLDIQLGDMASPISVRIGAGREPTGMPDDARVVNLSGKELSVRNIAGIRIPAKRWSSRPLAAGEEIALAVTLWTHARAYRVDWRGKYGLAEF